jgi:hypothetical protein
MLTYNLIICFQDTVQALVADCDHPSVKRMKNVEAYMNRCEYYNEHHQKWTPLQNSALI